jgi:hypothetical protein
MLKATVRRLGPAAVLGIVLTSAHGATIPLGNILGSYAFGIGGAVPTGTYSYNIWNDVTGAILTADNGDLADLILTYTRTAPSGVPSGTTTASLNYNAASDEFQFAHAYTQGSGAGFPTGNNPGTRIVNAVTFLFASHVTVSDLRVDFRSLNTAGITWEVSLLGFLQPDGSPFSTMPSVSPYLGHTTVNGSPSAGWFLVDSKGTLSGVGTSATSAGANGPLENLTGTGGNGYLDYFDVGLPAGTHVGGFI